MNLAITSPTAAPPWRQNGVVATDSLVLADGAIRYIRQTRPTQE
jgi:hypothetical protein